MPKPLVPVVGEPISAHILRWLKSFGYDEIAMNVHYLAETIEERFGDGSDYGVKLHYLYEPKLMGSAGALKALEDFFTEPFVVVGCDCLTDANLESLVKFHRKAEGTGDDRSGRMRRSRSIRRRDHRRQRTHHRFSREAAPRAPSARSW